MAVSTNMVSGLASGFDWRSMVDQLMEIERAPVNLMEREKTSVETQLAAWRSFNTRLLSLKSAAENLKDSNDFYVYSSGMSTDSDTVDAEDLLSISTSSTALPGSYAIQVEKLASAQKVSSRSFTDSSSALGASYAGDILLNGQVVTIGASDSLVDIRDKINDANSGSTPSSVSASIVNYGVNDVRLVLTSSQTGEDGMGLANGSSSDILEALGFKDSVAAVKNSITGGGQSDQFSTSTQNIKTMVGLSTTQSGTVNIGGTGVAIDLSADSLETIKNKINSAAIAGVTASVVDQVNDDGDAVYRLQIDGTQNFTDDQNILETLGVLEKGEASVSGTTAANALTTNGDTITASTLITDIDGYSTFTVGDTIDLSGFDHSGGAVASTFTITASSTVQDLLDEIESSFGNVTAYLTSDGKIEVADEESGASSLAVTLSSNLADGGSTLDFGAFSALDTVRERELIAGSDAQVEIDGVMVTSSDNTVDGILPGVTMDLKKADLNTTVTLNIEHDTDALMDKIESFTSAYNDVAGFIAQQQEYDEENETTGGVLFGDGTLSSVRNNLTSVLVQTVWGVTSEYSTLGLVGINVDTEGQLNIDSEKLRGLIESDFNEVRNLFVARGTSDVGTLSYVGSTKDTSSGDYLVHITQAATQSASTSDNAFAGTLGSDETITVTDGDKAANVDLTAGMTLSDVINALNTEFDKEYTQTLAGDNAILTGGLAATASTKWQDIDGATLANEDSITFTGTTRGGSTISGSYQITDAASEDIQDFLSVIEEAFNDEVTAGIDSSGRITVTDRSSGNSDISIIIGEPAGKGLDFGSVSDTNAGGTTGRYALEVTATADETDHLVLTSDYYGSSHNFDISETADLFWTGDQTVNNGQDVAGTINGEAATGSGQVLTGDDDEANIDGLVIQYTGTAENVDVGNIAVTFGVAELFDRAMYTITDSIDGYVTAKQESLEDRIEKYETDIEAKEARLQIKMQTMINRFVAMETALSQIQNQGDWLTSQLASVSSGWRI